MGDQLDLHLWGELKHSACKDRHSTHMQRQARHIEGGCAGMSARALANRRNKATNVGIIPSYGALEEGRVDYCFADSPRALT